MTKKMKVSEYIVNFFAENGVETFFGHIGGFNANIVDAVYLNTKINFVLNYHEQASSFACNGYATVKGDIAVATSSGAPSSCNLIAGIANAYFDSLPCIFLAGSVHSLAIRTCKKIRQNVFEEIDLVHMVSDITKYATRIDKPENIRIELEKALYIAREGRKGPVLLDIPYDIARSEINSEELENFVPPTIKHYSDIDVAQIKALLQNAKKPIILLGGGTRSVDCRQNIKKLLNKVKIPVVTSLCGLDALSHDNECFTGFIGHYGHRYANLALANCDFVIVLGSRLDERQLGGYQSKLEPNAMVIRVDVDKEELCRKIPENISIHSTAEIFLEKFSEENFTNYDFSKWFEVISTWKKRYPSYNLKLRDMDANNFLHKISDYLPNNAVICSDVGQNQMCVAQALRIDKDRKLLNCGGYGTMGFSLPAAIGAAYARKDTLILSVNGDGGIQMNIQELQTIKRDNLPVIVLILNNNCLGMIRRLQENMYDNRTSASVTGYSVPNYSAIAGAYGLKYLGIDSFDKYRLVKDFIKDSKPSIIEVFLPLNMRNYPEPGQVLDRQNPILSDEEYNLIKKECNF